MGKKQIKKRLKEKELEENVTSKPERSEAKKFGITLGFVLGIFGITLLILNIFMDEVEELIDNETGTPVEERVSNNRILAQDTFDQKAEEYVVFYVNGEEGLDELTNYYSSLDLGVATGPLYIVDMAEAINGTHLVDDSAEVEDHGKYASSYVEYNKEPTKSSEVEVYNFPTVMHIQSGELLGYYEGSEFYEPLGVTNPDAQTGQ